MSREIPQQIANLITRQSTLIPSTLSMIPINSVRQFDLKWALRGEGRRGRHATCISGRVPLTITNLNCIWLQFMTFWLRWFQNIETGAYLLKTIYDGSGYGRIYMFAQPDNPSVSIDYLAAFVRCFEINQNTLNLIISYPSNSFTLYWCYWLVSLF